MNKLFVVAKNELLRYFISPLAYVYLIAFLLLNGSFAVYFGSFFERGSADLSSMFAFQPWLLPSVYSRHFHAAVERGVSCQNRRPDYDHAGSCVCFRLGKVFLPPGYSALWRCF